MNTEALRAQMSAMRNSRTLGLRGVSRCTDKRPEDGTIAADQRSGMHRAKAFAPGQTGESGVPRVAFRVLDDDARFLHAGQPAGAVAELRLAQLLQGKRGETHMRCHLQRAARLVEDRDQAPPGAVDTRKRGQDELELRRQVGD